MRIPVSEKVKGNLSKIVNKAEVVNILFEG